MLKPPESMQRALCAAALALLASVATAQTISFVNDGLSTWRFYDAAAAPDSAWAAASFNDASWGAGTGQLGYGEGDEETVVGVANRVSNYFRTRVFIAQPALFTWQVSGLVDDGCVVYINGVEVWRFNMPGGVVNHTTLAVTAISGSGESTVRTSDPFSPSVFVAGWNVLAVEVHQDAIGSSDLSLSLQLQAFLINATVAGTTATSLVPKWSSWRFQDNGAFDTTFRGLAYNDSAWKTGPSTVGYGDPSVNTTAARNGVVTFFRKRFVAGSATQNDLLVQAFVQADDGAALYLNGVEGSRRENMPAPGVLLATTLASSVKNPPEESAFSATPVYWAASVLRPDTDNVVVAEVHQGSTSSSDMFFDLTLELLQLVSPSATPSTTATPTVSTTPAVSVTAAPSLSPASSPAAASPSASGSTVAVVLPSASDSASASTAPASPSASTTAASSSQPPSSPSSTSTRSPVLAVEVAANNRGASGLSSGTVAGIAVGVIVGTLLLLLMLVVLFVVMRRRRQRQASRVVVADVGTTTLRSHASDSKRGSHKRPLLKSHSDEFATAEAEMCVAMSPAANNGLRQSPVLDVEDGVEQRDGCGHGDGGAPQDTGADSGSKWKAKNANGLMMVSDVGITINAVSEAIDAAVKDVQGNATHPPLSPSGGSTMDVDDVLARMGTSKRRPSMAAAAAPPDAVDADVLQRSHSRHSKSRPRRHHRSTTPSSSRLRSRSRSRSTHHGMSDEASMVDESSDLGRRASSRRRRLNKASSGSMSSASGDGGARHRKSSKSLERLLAAMHNNELSDPGSETADEIASELRRARRRAKVRRALLPPPPVPCPALPCCVQLVTAAPVHGLSFFRCPWLSFVLLCIVSGSRACHAPCCSGVMTVHWEESSLALCVSSLLRIVVVAHRLVAVHLVHPSRGGVVCVSVRLCASPWPVCGVCVCVSLVDACRSPSTCRVCTSRRRRHREQVPAAVPGPSSPCSSCGVATHHHHHPRRAQRRARRPTSAHPCSRSARRARRTGWCRAAHATRSHVDVLGWCRASLTCIHHHGAPPKRVVACLHNNAHTPIITTASVAPSARARFPAAALALTTASRDLPPCCTSGCTPCRTASSQRPAPYATASLCHDDWTRRTRQHPATTRTSCLCAVRKNVHTFDVSTLCISVDSHSAFSSSMPLWSASPISSTATCPHDKNT